MPQEPENPSAKDRKARVIGAGEETIGKLAQELLGSPIVTGAVQRAMDVRERATQAQEAAFGAFNVPSAADIERLTRRVRSVSQRLEAIEDAVDRLDERIASLAKMDVTAVSSQLDRIEAAVDGLADAKPASGGRTAAKRSSSTSKASGASKASGGAKSSGTAKAGSGGGTSSS